MKLLAKLILIIIGLALIPITAVATAALKQRQEDGPNRIFSGGPLIAGELYQGPEPDWEFVNSIATIELQLEEPPVSRRIWVASYGGRLYIWSGYMHSSVGRLWKQWPVQAEANGKAILRIEGTRYERDLRRVRSGSVLDGIAAEIASKYPSETTRETVESGQVWLFEAAPRTMPTGGIR
ncbi:MAG: hypothetical protein OXE78_02980 [Gammaproteobacteria bacterium]|nr:hypothetical protein [Gammaproteobacteria bacterium]MCY4357871.1 hypothetical protein [Gammaproteobacteria bacterium]